jgi:cytochrome c oxidase cbb3-type subunit 2
LGATNLANRLTAQDGWQLPLQSESQKLDGAKLVQQYCVTCHAANGAVRQRWGNEFKKLPPDFATGPFAYAPTTADVKWRRNRLAQIIKFGLPATDMPGHEYLPDAEIVAMADYLAKQSVAKQP